MKTWWSADPERRKSCGQFSARFVYLEHWEWSDGRQGFSKFYARPYYKAFWKCIQVSVTRKYISGNQILEFKPQMVKSVT